MASASIEALSQVPLFSHLSKRELGRILAVCEEYAYAADKVIAKEGAAGEAIFVVLEGQARVVRRGRIVALLWPGDFFGEISLLDGGPRTATVVAETPVRCLLLLRKEFLTILDDDAQITSKLLQATARRLRQMDHPLRG